jgi:hypothetical protein
MSYGSNVWRSWHIKNCAIHMFKWEGWWMCKFFLAFENIERLQYLIKNCPPKQTMTLLFWPISNVVCNLWKPQLNHHFHPQILPQKNSLCFEIGPLSMWQNILHISKEYFATSQKVNPCGTKIFDDVAWNLL